MSVLFLLLILGLFIVGGLTALGLIILAGKKRRPPTDDSGGPPIAAP